ncbi:MAG: cation diffusion facilitator family transporter [Erysipelotrichaceae bacterium]|nr:cation diffusion facilitator family transporter [Erysipelotrichaceae bacterium]
MINLIYYFLKRRNQNDMRQNYGMACGILGILLNVLLFAFKLTIGLLSGFISITADAFNNLSDSASSLLTLVGFKIAGKKADNDHPFGHGRFEYIVGMIIALLIMLVGFELLIASIRKIINPTPFNYDLIVLLVMLAGIIVKLYMSYYNFKIAKLINSTTIMTVFNDSLMDVISSSIVLVAVLISHFFTINIDGYAGIIVALFILNTGYQSLKSTINPLLGQPPNPTYIEKIKLILADYPQILAYHDLIIHDYGPLNLMVSLHVEVDADSDLLVMHNIINDIEEDIKTALECQVIIHIDPIAINDPVTDKLYQTVLAIIKEINSELSIHDFRVVKRSKQNKVYFDVMVPFTLKSSDHKLSDMILDKLHEPLKGYQINLQIDRY